MAIQIHVVGGNYHIQSTIMKVPHISLQYISSKHTSTNTTLPTSSNLVYLPAA